MGKHRVRIQEQPKNHHRHHHAAEEARLEPTEHGSANADLKHDLDEILDEIDSVLEENAEGFVPGDPKGKV
jgi:ubiquitin-like protein Pup